MSRGLKRTYTKLLNQNVTLEKFWRVGEEEIKVRQTHGIA